MRSTTSVILATWLVPALIYALVFSHWIAPFPRNIFDATLGLFVPVGGILSIVTSNGLNLIVTAFSILFLQQYFIHDNPTASTSTKVSATILLLLLLTQFIDFFFFGDFVSLNWFLGHAGLADMPSSSI